MCPKLIEYCELKLEENGNRGIMAEDFQRFNGLWNRNHNQKQHIKISLNL